MVLLALAVFQAYAQRFAISPDGMSYLDLSDAVTMGDWRRLVDLYWSPVYPGLIGLARLVTGAGPRNEIAVVHAVNVVCFASMLAAFEYLLTPVLALSARVRGAPLSGRWSHALAYSLFGAFALAMTPLELTTPDLLSNAAIFIVLGALLRLRQSESSRDAVILGVTLGAGGLVKSFLIPWAAACLLTLAAVLPRRGVRQIAIAGSAWLLFIVPWSVALSVKAGRPTFGDAGRLTYAWFVNRDNPPNAGGVPADARSSAADAILPGVGVPGDSPYADPMWADPARYHRSVVPHFRWSDQARTLKVFHVFYIDNLAPLLFLVFFLVTAPRDARREAWRLGWPVYVPAVAGLFGYAMVLVTSRYVMPFVLAPMLIFLATIPLARRLSPLLAPLGLIIPVALEAALPEPANGLAIVTCMIGAVFAAVLVPSSRRLVWIPLLALGLVVTRVIFPLAFPALVLAAACALVFLYWRTTLAAFRAHRTVWFAQRTHAALGVTLAIMLLFRLGLRFNQDRAALARAASTSLGNGNWKIAQDLATHGVAPGTRIALIGPHAEAYWARTARLHIVASVPRLRAAAFWQLPAAAQDSLLALFHAAGATTAIASLGPAGAAPGASWIPVTYQGWIRPLDK